MLSFAVYWLKGGVYSDPEGWHALYCWRVDGVSFAVLKLQWPEFVPPAAAQPSPLPPN